MGSRQSTTTEQNRVSNPRLNQLHSLVHGRLQLDRTPESVNLLEVMVGTPTTFIKSRSTSKYTFQANSSASCPICFENFKENDIMSVNSCYHYWCINCEEKFTTYKCPWCEVHLTPNSFLLENDQSELCQKNEHEMNCLNIINEDKDKDKNKIESE
jgi:hypothetical protein